MDILGRIEQLTTVTPHPKPRKRLRDKKYLKHVALNHCLFPKCVAYAGQAHHIRDHTGMSLKPDDYDTIPLCIVHHDLAHNDPKKFAQSVGREEVFGSILKNILGYAEEEGWDMAEIYEYLVGNLIEWISRHRGKHD